VATKTKIVLDLIFFDMATGTFRGEFIATSGRLYEANEKTGDVGIRRIVQHAFYGADNKDEASGIEVNFLMSGYRTPPVLAAIARDTSTTAMQGSTGRDLVELDADPTLATAERRIMAQWGMEAFTNPRAIGATVAYVRAHELFANPNFAPLRALNYRVLTIAGGLPVVSWLIDLPTNGTVLSRANTYTYRTADFVMSTTQDYARGSFGNQQHLFHVTLDDGVTLFHTHPAVWPRDPPPNGNAPGYWTGNGRLPVSCQDGPVNISIYDLPEKAGFGRKYTLPFTHLYAPLRMFSRVSLQGRHLFLQYKDALIGITAAEPLVRNSDSEIVQRGRRTVWITEAGSARLESFDAFAARVRKAATFTGRSVTYRSGQRTLSADFDSGCAVDGAALQTQYARHSSKYAQIPRDPAALRIAFGGHALRLNFGAQTRLAN